MKEIKKVLICGIGAIGSIFAKKISEYDNENLKILVDENRLKNYKESPKVFNGEPLNLNYILPTETSFQADLIIIATKFTSLNEVKNNIQNFVKDDTIILSILNGVTSEEILAEKYSWKHIPLSYFIGHSEMENKTQITYDEKGILVFGRKDERTELSDIEKIKTYFEKANIKYQVPEDMLYSYWFKYLLNVSTNQPSAILHLTFKEMLSNKSFMQMIEKIMLEVQQIAKAEGVKNTEKMIPEAKIALTKLTPEGKTSMLQDVEAKRITEVEMFAGTMIELGQKHNIPTPYNEVLKDMILTIQENY